MQAGYQKHSTIQKHGEYNMHCQICNTYSDKDISTYNEQTGKMDFICGSCSTEIYDVTLDYYEQDVEYGVDLDDLYDGIDGDYE